jgi:hypothetical protein
MIHILWFFEGSGGPNRQPSCGELHRKPVNKKNQYFLTK